MHPDEQQQGDDAVGDEIAELALGREGDIEDEERAECDAGRHRPAVAIDGHRRELPGAPQQEAEQQQAVPELGGRAAAKEDEVDRRLDSGPGGRFVAGEDVGIPGQDRDADEERHDDRGDQRAGERRAEPAPAEDRRGEADQHAAHRGPRQEVGQGLGPRDPLRIVDGTARQKGEAEEQEQRQPARVGRQAAALRGRVGSRRQDGHATRISPSGRAGVTVTVLRSYSARACRRALTRWAVASSSSAGGASPGRVAACRA